MRVSNALRLFKSVAKCTAKPTEASILSALHAEKQKQETIGPFPINSGANLDSSSHVKFRDLSFPQKIVRSSKNSSRFAVVLVGLGVTGLVFYSFSTEVFDPNSPSSLFSTACTQLDQAQELQHVLPAPRKYSIEPFSRKHKRDTSNRRGTALPTTIMLSPSKMQLTFFVQAHQTSDLPFYERWYNDAHGFISSLVFPVQPPIPSDLDHKPVRNLEPKSFSLLGPLIARMGGPTRHHVTSMFSPSTQSWDHATIRAIFVAARSGWKLDSISAEGQDITTGKSSQINCRISDDNE